MEFLQVSISQKFREVINLLIAPDPRQRCDAVELIQHPFFSQGIPGNIKTTPNDQISHIYYLWLRYKNIDSIQKFEQYLIANEFLPYLPPVLQISNVLQRTSDEQTGVTILNRVHIGIDGLMQEIKKDQDIETITVKSKLFSDEISIKPESFIGKLGTIFRSKSAKSTHSESSMKSKKSDIFSNTYKKYKSQFSQKVSRPVSANPSGKSS